MRNAQDRLRDACDAFPCSFSRARAVKQPEDASHASHNALTSTNTNAVVTKHRLTHHAPRSGHKQPGRATTSPATHPRPGRCSPDQEKGAAPADLSPELQRGRDANPHTTDNDSQHGRNTPR